MKRSPIARHTPLRATAPAKAELPTAKCKAKGCRVKFVKLSMNHRACSIECARVVVAQDKAEKARKDAREHKAKLADHKPLSHWLDATQRVVNAFVIQRDAGKACISCGCWEAMAWDAGHYLSRGARPELRFTLANIAKQCASCNRHKGGNQAQYRIGLVARIGLATVEALEGPHPTAKFTRDGLAQLRAEIRRLARELEKGNA